MERARTRKEVEHGDGLSLSTVPFLIDASIVFPPDPAPLASPWVSPVLGWKGGESVALPCYQRGGPVARGEVRCPPKAEVVSSNLAGSANRTVRSHPPAFASVRRIAKYDRVIGVSGLLAGPGLFAGIRLPVWSKMWGTTILEYPLPHPHQALSPTRVTSERKPGRYADGNGLYLEVDAPEQHKPPKKRWVLRVVVNGRRRDMGLGGLRTTSSKKPANLQRSIARLPAAAAILWRSGVRNRHRYLRSKRRPRRCMPSTRRVGAMASTAISGSRHWRHTCFPRSAICVST